MGMNTNYEGARSTSNFEACKVLSRYVVRIGKC